MPDFKKQVYALAVAATLVSSQGCSPQGMSSTPTPSPSVTANVLQGNFSSGSSCQSTSGIVTVQTGGNCASSIASGAIDLSIWELQEPVGTSGNPTTISGSQLAAGYSDSYFQNTGGTLTFTCPTNGVTTANSQHPRTELKEIQNWGLGGTSTMTATVTGIALSGVVAIGQIHTSGIAPWFELFYDNTGALSVLLESQPQQGNGVNYNIGNVPLNTPINYQIQVTNTTLNLTVNGMSKSWQVPPAFQALQFYFKAGDYIQYTSGSDAVVRFSALSVTHG